MKILLELARYISVLLGAVLIVVLALLTLVFLVSLLFNGVQWVWSL